MSENNISWFHCGSCGSLFQSQVGNAAERVCSECGRDPSISDDPAQVGLKQPYPHPETLPAHAGAHSEDRGKRPRRNYTMLKILLGWTLLFASMIPAARLLFRDNAGARKPSAAEAPLKIIMTDEDGAFIDAAAPLCNQVFAGFLSVGTPEARNQFVSSPITTASRMARFYEMNPMLNIDPGVLSRSKTAVLDLPGGKALETVWNFADGRTLDAVFVKEADEWRLDWEHFVRYSDYPWPLFLAGSGEDMGEFRLLARERLAEQRKGDESISIVLYAPKFGNANETGFQSPEFLVNRLSENGQLLEKAFKMEKDGQRAYGVKLPSQNPEGLIRVRVKIRRVEGNMERKFELEKVIACHWYSTADSGLKNSDLPPAQTPPE